MRIALDELNPPQREAVTTVDGPLLVLAGAGSGKTRVITYRIAHLLGHGVLPQEILAVSFTNKAASEMQTRVERLVGARGRGLTLSTFHALGLAILKAEKTALGFQSGFTIYDASDQLGLVRELLRRVQIDDRRFDPKAILFRISRAKNAFLTPEEYAAATSDNDYDLIAAEIYPKYEAALKDFHAFDFDDLITATVRLLERDAAVRGRWQSRYRYLMIDEYQDTNRAQFHLMSYLVRAHGNLCVVGDDDQSIYGWRGAESGNILEFERHFPGAKVVRLEENYRSTPTILEAANAVIAHNLKRHPKRLWTARQPGQPIQLVVADDAEAEARFVAEEIQILCATRGYRPSDCAVLYRSNVQSRPLEEALRADRIAYQVVGGQAFFDRKEVKDAIAYLKLALQPRDELSLRRVINYPARGIGAHTLECLEAYAKVHRLSLYEACRRARLPSLFDATPQSAGAPVEELGDKARTAVNDFCDLVEQGRARFANGANLKESARAYLEAVGLADDLRSAAASATAAQRRLANLEGLFESIERFEKREGRDFAGFLHRLTLVTDDDSETGPADQVTLVTLHGAKGLEFPVVFLVGMEEELLPHRRTLYPSSSAEDDVTAAIDLGEERRLLYVGITRAREILYLTRARARATRSTPKPRSPSRFLAEVPVELCEVREAGVPKVANPDEAEAFARASLAQLFKLTGE